MFSPWRFPLVTVLPVFWNLRNGSCRPHIWLWPCPHLVFQPEPFAFVVLCPTGDIYCPLVDLVPKSVRLSNLDFSSSQHNFTWACPKVHQTICGCPLFLHSRTNNGKKEAFRISALSQPRLHMFPITMSPSQPRSSRHPCTFSDIGRRRTLNLPVIGWS